MNGEVFSRAIPRVAILVAWALTVAGCNRYFDAVTPFRDFVRCQVTRQECTGFEFAANEGVVCSNAVPVSIPQVTACFDNSIENAASACQRYCRRPVSSNDPTAPDTDDPNLIDYLYDLPAENCQAVVLEARPAAPGECSTIPNVASNGPTARVSCTLGGRICTETETVTGTTICTSRSAVITETRDGCFDPTKESAASVCGAHTFASRAVGNPQFQEPRVNIASVSLNSDLCDIVVESQPLTTYGISSGAVGTVVHGSQSFGLNATGGFLGFRLACDSSGEFCELVELRRLRIILSDVAVAGTTIRNVEGQLTQSAPVVLSDGVRKIPKEAFRFELVRPTPGGLTHLPVFPSNDVSVSLSGSSVTLTFSATFKPVAGMGGVAAEATVSIVADTGNSGATCANFNAIQTIMGFEDLGWNSAQAQLSLSPSLHTQGCSGLRVPGSGYLVTESARFATPLSGVSPTLKLDAFVPSGQPNPHWFGAVQLYVSCPSAGMNNAYLGQVELTGKPIGAFSTLSYGVPGTVQSVLSGTHDDCFFSVALNVNPTPTPVVLDNLRFSP